MKIPGWHLRLKRPLPERCTCDALLPDVLARLDQQQVCDQRFRFESEDSTLGEWFDCLPIDSLPSTTCSIEMPSPTTLRLSGDLSRLDLLGAQMQSGIIEVEGNCGHQVGSGMKAGSIRISGSVGDHLSSQQMGGSIVVERHAGDFVGGLLPGARKGMLGGTCIVQGNVGRRLGWRMRRGTIFVGGRAGDEGACEMIAGTIVVEGSIGTNWMVGSKRGTLITRNDVLQATSAILSEPRRLELSFLTILWRHLISIEPRFCFPDSCLVQRRVFDRSVEGKAELLVLQSEIDN